MQDLLQDAQGNKEYFLTSGISDHGVRTKELATCSSSRENEWYQPCNLVLLLPPTVVDLNKVCMTQKLFSIMSSFISFFS